MWTQMQVRTGGRIRGNKRRALFSKLNFAKIQGARHKKQKKWDKRQSSNKAKTAKKSAKKKIKVQIKHQKTRNIKQKKHTTVRLETEELGKNITQHQTEATN